MRPPKNHNVPKPPPPFPPSFIAKTFSAPGGASCPGVDVFTHCKIVGMVAREWMQRQLEWLVQKLFPCGSELIAAIHDIGKISPGFQEKIYRSLDMVPGLAAPDLDKNVGYHFTVSQAAARDLGRYVPEIVGRHHGISPASPGYPDDEIYGGPTWQAERMNTVKRLREYFQSSWPEVVSDIHADVLSGLTTVADWIGSALDICPDAPQGLPSDEELSRMTAKALDDAGFIRPRINSGLTFKDIFSFSPYSLQAEMAQAVSSPGVYVLEAPMGMGKTEAALFAAYKALEENRATGVYFALPTQLTSDKMHERMNKFLDVILDQNCPHKNALLLHSAAWLRATEMGEDGRPDKSWFDYRKRGLLAPFAVGTVDQALMAAMNVKHGFVRTFALAGKCVILDEVHSYDAYTGVILDRLVQALREIHCTVIILSATLDTTRRAELIYSPGETPASVDDVYPLITAHPNSGPPQAIASPAVEEPEILTRIHPDDEEALEEAIDRAQQGQQVLWIENTVDGAREVFQRLGARTAGLGIESGLIHSRFLKVDRETNESYWSGVFGKTGREKRGEQGRILVGTQVLEQSLDIDGDFLVSRLCPTDMILQRLGRLWRHDINVRPKGARREAWILGPALEAAQADRQSMGKSAVVYAPYVLCRSLDVWEDQPQFKLTGVKIRALMAATYSHRDDQGSMAAYKQELERVKDKLSRLARTGLSRSGKTLSETRAQTRYSEIEITDVLLIKSKIHDRNGTRLELPDGTSLVLSPDRRLRDKAYWRKAAARIQLNTVTVPEKLAPAFHGLNMNFLKGFVYLGEDDERPFRAAMVRESGVLAGLDGQEALPGYELKYDSVLGYRAIQH
ncbi:CRISPR-associated helicase Cas3 [Desulfatibacillum aliphaticivorans]|uniref:CRISPR-associated helicase Cas3 n=1 Tax=Desulfatibacillum aliphaticivorans TaxID=218208 RepID=B8FDH5_DESAL|nr:CRISPR-associated helicase Cas3' [Desulfatibacillum aliphaticivorans]ACL06606.1 CRISPR-associated helicase Cas3 [Desulfatibacillum aliphaticivorans]